MHVLEALLMYQDISQEDSTYNKMIRTMLAHLDVVKSGTIYDVAELCYTSTSSVGRLCTRLGYGSFAAFRAAIADALDDYAFSDYFLLDSSAAHHSLQDLRNTFADVLQNQAQVIREMDMQVLEEIAQLMHSRNAVHFFVPMLDPKNFIPLQTSLILSGKQSYLHHGSFGRDKEEAGQVTGDDVALLVIPNYQRWNYMVKLFREIQNSGAATVLMITKDRACWDSATIKLCLRGNNSIIDSDLYGAILELVSCIYRAKYLLL